ncbi:MAG: OmpA family protein [Candidatus Accumulibacter sp.]|nr:OmpA family protein [Accumulibacter sp.]
MKIKRSVAATLAALSALCTLGGAGAAWSRENNPIDERRQEEGDESAYPLPAGLTRNEAQAMRSAFAGLPRRAPDGQETLSESAVGALFEPGSANLTPAARAALERLARRYAGKPGLRLAVAGHTDGRGLSAQTRRYFKDNRSIAEARALAAADFLRRQLGLPVGDVAMAGRGDGEPVASNATPEGMARNRRVVLSVWFDPRPAQVPPAPSQPHSQSSPAPAAPAAPLPSSAAENAATPGKRIDNGRVEVRPVPPPGEVQPEGFSYPLPSGVTLEEARTMRAAAATLPARGARQQETLSESGVGALFESGKADLRPAAREALVSLARRYAGKPGLRLSVVGHTDNQRLSAPTRRLFSDNQGLSEARALAVANLLRRELNLPAQAAAISGKGETSPVASNATPEGMARNRRVEIGIWYEDAAQQAAAPVAAPAVPAVSCAPQTGDADLPFRITVDGEDVSGAPVNEADRQRCTDVALERADIQVKYDDLAAKPALNVWPDKDLVLRGAEAVFRGWSNYQFWVKRAEVRIFRRGQRPDAAPLAVVPFAWERPVAWKVPAEGNDEYAYLLRVYDEQGSFDETALKALNVASHPRPVNDLSTPEREAMTGWGENALMVSNIPVRGGTVSISGRRIQPGQTVKAMGLPAPVDGNGRFVLRQILPSGPHSVDVQVVEADGRSASFRRNLYIPDSDWFYIAVGDLTLGNNTVRGPAALVSNDTQHYQQESYVDGRGAFYLKGKVKGEWLLTAAADTREQPLKDLFSNFSAKDPRYLLRNIDPDAYYPVYGDDSTTVDDAPTQGKFYVRLEKGDSQVLWGNFRSQWNGSELIQYSRGLYGARGVYRSEEATGFGERRSNVEAFAADPGTIGTRDEFRGTGGSLYYLRHQDLTRGSERIWVEVRDKDSGLVLERKQLTPAQDYEINYLQGRIMLRELLPSTAGGSSLFYTSGLSGNPLYLVTTYEYVPGITAVSNLATGLQANHWVNDYLRLGLTSYHQGESGNDQSLKGVDVTVRLAPGTRIKAEVARSSGSGGVSTTSIDGGFGFANQNSGPARDATAARVEASVDLAEVSEDGKGKVSAYVQDRQRGFSGPGQIALNGEAVRQAGVRAAIPVGESLEVQVKADDRKADTQDYRNAEAAVRVAASDEWAVTVGVRQDERVTRIANASPILSQNGTRTDLLSRVDYRPNKDDGQPGEKEDWAAYAFVQGTAARSGNRDENDRAGLGGSWRVNDRIKLNAEASDGSMGAGGLVGADYRISDRSNAYLNYRMETESPDVAYRGRYGSWISGSDYRVSDEMRVFGQTRTTSGAGPQSLTQAFGVDLAPNDRWTYGGKVEFGKISDPLAGDLERRALGINMGYKEKGTKYAGALEFRSDDTSSGGARRTWLMRNTFGQQLDRAWRLLGKFNISRSSNSQGAFYDGDFHEIVAGAAYRPVDNDRWNTLVKYTNFYNLPSPGQLTTTGTTVDYAQKSQVFSVDTIWDARPWLSLGVKYGLRIGELKNGKADGEWYSSRADLVVLRADWHWIREWDVVTELRNLRAREAQDAKAGALLAAYRHLGQNVKVGAGYNFTTYSDDLTNLSYRSRGWFLNILSTL